jgi:hypothetical protein
LGEQQTANGTDFTAEHTENAEKDGDGGKATARHGRDIEMVQLMPAVDACRRNFRVVSTQRTQRKIEIG